MFRAVQEWPSPHDRDMRNEHSSGGGDDYFAAAMWLLRSRLGITLSTSGEDDAPEGAPVNRAKARLKWWGGGASVSNRVKRVFTVVICRYAFITLHVARTCGIVGR